MTKTVMATDAEANRQRVKEGYGNNYYEYQRKVCRGWGLGEIIPKDLSHAELPTVSGFDRRIGDVVDWIWRAE